jgi:hypothetical protein
MRLGLVFAALNLPPQAHALAVDKELVLLVDVSNSGLKKSESPGCDACPQKAASFEGLRVRKFA